MDGLHHPLQISLDRLRQHHPLLDLKIGELPSGWLLASQLTAVFSQHLYQFLPQLKEQSGISDKRAAGSLFFGLYNWFPVTTALGTFLLDQRVPDLSPYNLQFQFTKSGRVQHMGLDSGR